MKGPELSSIRNQRVLVRVNYDIPNPDSIARIADAIPTIKALTTQNNQVILLSHLGRPDGNDKSLSLQTVLAPLQKVLVASELPQAVFVDQYQGGQIPSGAPIILLENTRFDPRERGNATERMERAKEYATFGDVFVDEAFAVSHRHEASNHEIKELLPCCLGIAHQRELDELRVIKNNPAKPYIAIMGGAKLETKIGLIRHILEDADKVLLGGLICFPFYAAIHSNSTEHHMIVDSAHLTLAKELINEFGDRIIIPIDFIQDDPTQNPHDIGPRTIQLYRKLLAPAKTIFWNGPMGWYENEKYQTGTLAIGSILASSQAHTAIGGGDTGESLPQEIKDGIDYISMGGGATLKYLSQ